MSEEKGKHGKYAVIYREETKSFQVVRSTTVLKGQGKFFGELNEAQKFAREENQRATSETPAAKKPAAKKPAAKKPAAKKPAAKKPAAKKPAAKKPAKNPK